MVVLPGGSPCRSGSPCRGCSPSGGGSPSRRVYILPPDTQFPSRDMDPENPYYITILT